MIKQVIRDILIAQEKIISSVGNRVSPSISGIREDLPRIVFERYDIESSYNLNGVADQRTDGFNFTVIAETMTECDLISEDLKSILEAQLDMSHGSIKIKRIYLESYGESNYLPDGRETPIFQNILGFKVVYNVSA